MRSARPPRGAAAPKRVDPRARRAAPSAFVVVACVVVGLGLFLAAAYRPAFRVPFIADDYVFLDKTAHASFASLWSRSHLTFGWYRPWSREFHYWALVHTAGLRPLVYHAANAALWLAVMAAYALLVLPWLGAGATLVACAAVAASAAWGTPLIWIAGAQELWMLMGVLLALLATRNRWWAAAAVFQALALLSKETAAVAPAIALAGVRLIGRERWSVAWRRTAPLWGVTAAWVLTHPALAALLRHQPTGLPQAPRPAEGVLLARTALALVNLDRVPRPEHGWGTALLTALPAVAALALLAVLGAQWMRARHGAAEPTTPHAADDRGAAPSTGRVIAFGAAWAALGSAPLLFPSIGWHAYYGLLGAFGAWLAGAALLSARPVLGIVAVIALATLGRVQADTPSWDWSAPSYQYRSAYFVDLLRDDLMARHPQLPAHARLYFTRVPQNIGFMVGDGPAFRVWYGDRTLWGGYWSQYAPRPEGTPAGRDYFFRYDSTGTWVEVVKGPEDVARAIAANPNWETDHRDLALRLGRAGDWSGAAVELAKLERVRPEDFRYPLNLAIVLDRAGDSTGAMAAYARATVLRARAGAPDGVGGDLHR